MSLSTDLEYFGRTERTVTTSSVGPRARWYGRCFSHVWSVKVMDGDCGSQSFKKVLRLGLHDLYTRTQKLELQLQFISYYLSFLLSQLMVNWWFAAWWFGFLGSPCEMDCY